MYPAMLLMLLFVAFTAAVHEYAPPTRKFFSRLGLCLASLAAAVLLIDYFIQVTVMQPSLEKGQLDSWAMWTQYNPNGVFIALEELGYLLMSVALACVAPVFTQRNKVERTIRWLFVLSHNCGLRARRRLGGARNRSGRSLRDHRDLDRLVDAHRHRAARRGRAPARRCPLAPDVMSLSGGLARGLRRDPSTSHPVYPWGSGMVVLPGRTPAS